MSRTEITLRDAVPDDIRDLARRPGGFTAYVRQNEARRPARIRARTMSLVKRARAWMSLQLTIVALCNASVVRPVRTSANGWLSGAIVGVLLFLAAGYVLRACWLLPAPVDVIAAVGLVVLIVAAHLRLPAPTREVVSLGGGLIHPSAAFAGLFAWTALILGANALCATAMGPTIQQAVSEASGILPRTPSTWTRQIVYVVVFAPIVEELAARGWVQGSMNRHMHPALAIAAAAALFAVAHSFGAGRIVFPISAFLFGMFAGVVVLVTGTVWATVALHALANFLITAIVASGAHLMIAQSAGVSIVLGSALVLRGVVALWRVYGVLGTAQVSASPGISRGVA